MSNVTDTERVIAFLKAHARYIFRDIDWDAEALADTEQRDLKAAGLEDLKAVRNFATTNTPEGTTR